MLESVKSKLSLLKSKLYSVHTIFWLLLVVILLVSVLFYIKYMNNPIVAPLALGIIAGILSGMVINGLYSTIVFKDQVTALINAITLNPRILQDVFKDDKIDSAIESLLRAKLENELAKTVKQYVIDKMVELKSLAFETRQMFLVFEDIRDNNDKYEIATEINKLGRELGIEGDIINLNKLKKDFIALTITYESKELFPPRLPHTSRFIATDDDLEYAREESYEVEHLKRRDINQYTYFLPVELPDLINIGSLKNLLINNDDKNDKVKQIENLMAKFLFDVEILRIDDKLLEITECHIDRNLIQRDAFKVELIFKSSASQDRLPQDRTPIKIEWKSKTLLNKNEGYFFDKVSIPYNRVEYIVDYTKLTGVKHFETLPINPRHVNVSVLPINDKFLKVSFDGWTFPMVSLFISWIRESEGEKKNP